MIKCRMERMKDNELILSDEYSLEWEEIRNILNNKSESHNLLSLKKEYSRVGKYLVPVKFRKKYIDGTIVKYKFTYEMKGENNETQSI